MSQTNTLPRTIWLLTYRPLARYPKGPWQDHRDICRPFEDASCRREPDLRAEPATISSACRPDFAARLRPGDLIVYATVKFPYFAEPPHRRLVAVLEALQTHTHRGYVKTYGRPATNCIVPENPPLSYEFTEGFFEDERGKHSLQDVARRHRVDPDARQARMLFSAEWDRIYRSRKRYSNTVVACKKHFIELVDPPRIPEDVFAPQRFPVTQNAVKLGEERFRVLLAACDVGASTCLTHNPCR